MRSGGTPFASNWPLLTSTNTPIAGLERNAEERAVCAGVSAVRVKLDKRSKVKSRHFEEWSAELQIPRLPRISCRDWWRRELHAVFLTENRTRCPLLRREQEIRVRSVEKHSQEGSAELQIPRLRSL